MSQQNAEDNIIQPQVEVPAEVAAVRQPDFPVYGAIIARWSPRAFSTREVEEKLLVSVFEAARWAASSYNEQPWRFLLARAPEDRKKFLDFLLPANQSWAKDAPVLVLIASKKTFSHNGKSNATYQFDAGTSSGYLSLACAQHGLIAHGMAGFDGDMARASLGIPSDFEPLAVFAIGYHGDKSQLDEETAQREVPSGRRPIRESIMEGHFIQAQESQAEADTEHDG
jgi:nitroreductase